MGYSPWGRKELDMTKQLHFFLYLLCIGDREIRNCSGPQCVHSLVEKTALFAESTYAVIDVFADSMGVWLNVVGERQESLCIVVDSLMSLRINRCLSCDSGRERASQAEDVKYCEWFRQFQIV